MAFLGLGWGSSSSLFSRHFSPLSGGRCRRRRWMKFGTHHHQSIIWGPFFRFFEFRLSFRNISIFRTPMDLAKFLSTRSPYGNLHLLQSILPFFWSIAKLMHTIFTSITTTSWQENWKILSFFALLGFWNLNKFSATGSSEGNHCSFSSIIPIVRSINHFMHII